MPDADIRRVVTRVRRAVDRYGVRGTAHETRKMVSGARGRYRVHRAERAFDRRHGVDTAGIVRLHELAFENENKELGVRYEGIMPEAFDALLDGLDVGDRELTFIDLGAGKGRAMLLASRSPFRRIVGVEFSPQLAAIAQGNAARFRSADQRCTDITVECADATAWEFPDEPLLVYMFNPFAEPLIRQVIANLERSCARTPRRVVLVIANRTFPVELLADAGFRPLDGAGTRFERSA
jgi:SAM-dependent methyltransferase